MKTLKSLVVLTSIVIFFAGCKENMTESYSTNGETIFRTGKNKQGEVLQDIAKSQMKMAHSCQSCHGVNGKGMKPDEMMRQTMATPPSIRYVDLSNQQLHSLAYNDSLLIRFLDHELKSDSTVAQTGVVWKMSMQDKQDLIAFLKTL